VSLVASGIDVVPYRDDDLEPVLDLLVASLGPGPGGRRTPGLFLWKHQKNPFGRSFMLVARADDRIVGLRAFMRWEFRSGDNRVTAVRAVDTATHPEYRGRGIFSRLTEEALRGLGPQVDLVFNTPNARSGPGYLKLGWRAVGKVPVSVRVRRPLRVARGARSLRRRRRPPDVSRPAVVAEPAGEVLRALGGSLDELLRRVEKPGRRLHTPRTSSYLRWRYGGVPGLDYRAVGLRVGGHLRGLAIFRLRPRGGLWEASVAEVLVERGAVDAARALLRRVRRAVPVDHLTCSFPGRTAAARPAARGGFVRIPAGPTLMVNPLRDIEPPPTVLSSWGLALGDLEVF
jgi:GNAT superfamily N-acetyltransferase